MLGATGKVCGGGENARTSRASLEILPCLHTDGFVKILSGAAEQFVAVRRGIDEVADTIPSCVRLIQVYFVRRVREWLAMDGFQRTFHLSRLEESGKCRQWHLILRLAVRCEGPSPRARATRPYSGDCMLTSGGVLFLEARAHHLPVGSHHPAECSHHGNVHALPSTTSNSSSVPV